MIYSNESKMKCSLKEKTDSSDCLGIYLDNATLRRDLQSNEEKSFWGEKSSSYGVMRGLHRVSMQEEERLRSHFLMGENGSFFLTPNWSDIPKSIIRSSGKKKIAVCLTDSNAVLRACDEVRGEIEVLYLREKEEEVEESLLFLQYVNPLTGVLVEQEKIEEARKRGCCIALDISYAVGRVPLDTVLPSIDYLLIRGDALGVAFGFSCAIGRNVSLEKENTNERALHVFLQSIEGAFAQELCFTTEVARLKAIFEEGENVLFEKRERAPHISCISFPKVKNELLLFTLSRRDMFATIGGGPFPLLERMLPCVGFSYLDSMTALSFCFGSDIDEKVIVEAKTRLKRAVRELTVVSEGV